MSIKNWHRPLQISLTCHIALLVVLATFPVEQKKQKADSKKRQQSPIQSFLYFSKPPIKIVEIPSKTRSVNTKSLTSATSADTPPAKQTDVSKKLNKDHTVKMADKNKTPASQIPQQSHELKNKPSTNLMEVAKSQLASDNYQEWKQAKLTTESFRIQNSKQKLSTESIQQLGKPLLGKISGVRELAVSADGTTLIKVSNNCFSVKLSETQESLWVNATCPNSADPYRQQLRNSLNKYLPKK